MEVFLIRNGRDISTSEDEQDRSGNRGAAEILAANRTMPKLSCPRKYEGSVDLFTRLSPRLNKYFLELAKRKISHRIWHTTSTRAGFPLFTTLTASRKVLIRSLGSVIGPAPQQP